MNGNGTPSLDRNLGRLEARVADLTEHIVAMRQELSGLSCTVNTSIAGHQERLANLESFRRWAVGVLTGILLSGVAAAFAWALRTN
jgi:hypothetical protein